MVINIFVQILFTYFRVLLGSVLPTLVLAKSAKSKLQADVVFKTATVFNLDKSL